MSKSYGRGGITFNCIQMVRGGKKEWPKQIESPQQRQERIRKLLDRKEKRRA